MRQQLKQHLKRHLQTHRRWTTPFQLRWHFINVYYHLYLKYQSHTYIFFRIHWKTFDDNCHGGLDEVGDQFQQKTTHTHAQKRWLHLKHRMCRPPKPHLLSRVSSFSKSLYSILYTLIPTRISLNMINIWHTCVYPITTNKTWLYWTKFYVILL